MCFRIIGRDYSEKLKDFDEKQIAKYIKDKLVSYEKKVAKLSYEIDLIKKVLA